MLSPKAYLEICRLLTVITALFMVVGSIFILFFRGVPDLFVFSLVCWAATIVLNKGK